MRSVLAFTAVVTIATSAIAGNMSSDNDMKAMHSQINDNQSVENVLNNDEMKRPHKEMTRYGMSEAGMEARLQMISTDEGRAYHEALEKKEKKSAG